MELIGGLGLFLLGMITMTEGLRALAGDALRRWLVRATQTPLSGAVSGAVCTALLQSSSATTVAAVGFVAADLMSFPAALGIVFGANLGTTITGWMVALLGFKLKIGALAWVLVFAGAILRLFASGRLAAIGMAVAGFALIFVGVGAMQDAMVGIRDVFTFDRFTGATFTDRLALVAFGAAFTIVAQSSSAGVAATLTALHTGIVDFPQAASLVIGMDVGTTVTALAAATGAGVNARRTGLSHVVYNVMTGTAAFLLVPIYVEIWNTLAPGGCRCTPNSRSSAFTACSTRSASSPVLPFTRSFARLMERLVGGTVSGLHGQPRSRAARSAGCCARRGRQQRRAGACGIGSRDARNARRERHGRPSPRGAPDRAGRDPRVSRPDPPAGRCRPGLATPRRRNPRARPFATSACAARDTAADRGRDRGIGFRLPPECRTFLDGNPRDPRRRRARARGAKRPPPRTRCQCAFTTQKTGLRADVMHAIGAGNLDVQTGTKQLDALRWLRRTSKHVERATAHLHGARAGDGSREHLCCSP